MKTSTAKAALRGATCLSVFALSMGATGAFAQDAATTTTAAPAADAADTSANTIIVTGSISRNPAAQTASPVTVITSEDMQKKGMKTVADLVQNLAANNAGTLNSSWSSHGFATGASAPSLRGLNDGYTLTLFNGMRSAYYPLADDGERNFVDINSMPSDILDRVDVLQDGASATYGSDAIAGVVNVIVKRQIQGLHMDASAGISQRGDGGEKRISATYGYGDLDRQGFNIFANVMYQKNDALPLSARKGLSGTADQSSVCDSQGNCLTNGIRNGVQADGSYDGFQSTSVPFVRPVDGDLNPTGTGTYALANPSAGCGSLTAATLTSAQQAGTTAPSTVCQQDLVNQYGMMDSQIVRKGFTVKGTAKVGSNAEAFLLFNYYNVKTANQISPLSLTGQTAAGGTTETASSIFLPVYVCSQGVGSIDANGNLTASGCNASNGTLNPSNPYAAQGEQAQLSSLYDRPRETLTDAKTYRIQGGIDGTFGANNDWHYNVQGQTSWVTLGITNKNYINLEGLMNAVAQGTYNFADPSANTEAQRQLIAPDNYTRSVSKSSQLQASLDHDFFQLPGGMLNVAVTGQWRYEGVNNPSANAPNEDDPYDRYYSINAVGVDASRHVWSAGYQVTAPIVDMLTVTASGSYDHYSTGMQHFSPKFEAKFKPIRQVTLRGTFSKGFRVPSFMEAYAEPTTGYVSTSINCNSAVYTQFCADHNASYYGNSYSYGVTSQGNPDLKPETSTSYTFGTVIQPIHNVTLTVDYWHTKIKNVIIPVSVTTDMINEYYQNNGVVNVPGVTVTPGVADPNNPSALPLLGTISGSYTNADSYLAEGIDVGAEATVPLTKNLTWETNFQGSYLMKLQQTLADGTVQRYDGTLGPCNVTSCSGAPKWRLNWTNTLDFNGKGSISLTGYYTSGYSEVATDSGGVYGNCQASADNGQVLSFSDGSPVQCRAKATFDLDAHAEVKVADKFTLYTDIENLLDTKPDYEPNAAYGLYQYNPAWQEKLFMGRWMRVGVKIDI
ncbi:TonB-dependent receptor plug domain-containing protein [Novosphingobium sp. 9]|uniref:TonB-dependent receptor plug domain-containing protein n=1 Tax=Novosphingobium sp. 9 TaxID=2025349 RepID=UPI0021B51C3C|nr:TonB-dependent receptor [Novosphingobium sp. 9]